MISAHFRPFRHRVALLLIALITSASACFAANDIPELPAQKIVREINGARTVTIEHTVVHRVPVRFFTRRPCQKLANVATFRRELDRTWVESFAQALDIARLDSLARQPQLACLGDSIRHDRMLLTFGKGSRALSANVSLTQVTALYTREGAALTVPIEARMPELRTLIGRALPEDTLLATIPPCFPALAESLLTAEPPPYGIPLVDELPEVLHKVPPIYPEPARRSGIEGTVRVQALVDREGRVAATLITESISDLDEEAVRAVEEWSFKPARSKGAPVPVWATVPVTFRLR